MKNSAELLALRVSDYENREAGGLPLACKKIYRESLKYTSELRKRQGEYHAALPKDAKEAVNAARRLIGVDLNYLEDFELALHTADLIDRACASPGDLENDRESIGFMARRIARDLRETKRMLDLLDDILSAPQRDE